MSSTRHDAVGFIGLGQMGAPMATHLTGWPGGLVVYDTRPEAMAPLVEAGARAASSPAEVAQAAGIISVMVRDDDQVFEVVRAMASSVAASHGTKPGHGTEPGDRTELPAVLVAIHSTIRADTAPLLAAEFRDSGVEVIDAPVSGGFMGAHAGRLAVMVGGSRPAYERCREPPGDFSGLTVDHLFAEIWTRPGLTLRDRRLLLIGLLTGQGLHDVAEIQVGTALGNGELDAEQLREVVIFLTHYAGWPSGAKLSMQAEKIIAKDAKAKDAKARARKDKPEP